MKFEKTHGCIDGLSTITYWVTVGGRQLIALTIEDR
jgi:hypothetical protein